jgi:curved DNA-binding protein CbpA
MDPAETENPGESYDKVVDEFSFLIRDKNHDGVLERAEFDEGRSAFDQLSDPDRFDRYDLDGDGVVTREEFLKGRAADRDVEAAGAHPLGANDIPLAPGTGPLARREAED